MNYKKYFGGGRNYELRGKFQRDFLKKMYPQETRLLDVGCGAGRGTVYLTFFDYYGFDCNKEFVEIAQRYSKNIVCCCDFDPGFDLKFDVIWCFSVLQHCSKEERELFFKNIEKYKHGKTDIFISHAGWYTGDFKQIFNSEDITEYGFDKDEIFPIIRI